MRLDELPWDYFKITCAIQLPCGKQLEIHRFRASVEEYIRPAELYDPNTQYVFMLHRRDLRSALHFVDLYEQYWEGLNPLAAQAVLYECLALRNQRQRLWAWLKGVFTWTPKTVSN